eukprot:TRINITY_DN6313_c0_g1_i1.p1 TRINITY_DN6313_c0_g1~~TRINITY_DN6313_c0_g1_i1.p1  ORF type:complete len:199 (-),score=47.34 TRINITY_DN6313_c0_g1_i1:79-675(-)
MSDQTPPIVVFVLGGPGAGKSTQCRLLVESFGFVHLSAGDLLRAEKADANSKHGELIKKMIAQGEIVPSHITVSLLKNAMDASPANKFLIDGFPRNFENNDAWVADMGHVKVPYLLYFDCPESVMESRLLARGGDRIDDNIESIRLRFRTFVEQTNPVVARYRETEGVEVVTIDANKSVSEVSTQLHDLFTKFIADSS